MRDLGSKMAELKFEAPLARFEESEEWGSCDYISNRRHHHQQRQNNINDDLNLNLKDTISAQEAKMRLLEEVVRDAHVSKSGLLVTGGGADGTCVAVTLSEVRADSSVDSEILSPNCNTQLASEMNPDLLSIGVGAGGGDNRADNADNFTETFGGSLEDLVNTFDEKITKCFGNYEESVEELAPVQVRSQEEIMNECQMWWTITGNFGNILPIDWSKSYTRQMHVPTLHLGNKNTKSNIRAKDIRKDAITGDELNDLSSEDEAVAHDLDMHALILNGLSNEQEEPIKTVEEVIKEIDEIMDEADTPLDETEVCNSEVMEKAKEVLGATLHAEKLKYLSISQLNELYMEMEALIREFSETLINELALRDELEYEKELKNTFISILLAVQNKRRQHHVEKKMGKLQGMEPKYLTTVIPYLLENGTPNNQSLQVLIKILKAINEDSPTVPALLTDYILKVLCPT